jgi:DNA-binding NarL/FixJ family response regulator
MRVAICDDHPVVVGGIALLLRSIDESIGIDQFACAADLYAAAVHWTDIDLVLLDLGLPDSEGVDTLKKLRELREDVPVVVVSGTSDRQCVTRVIDLGAMGFIPKSTSVEEMLNALRTVFHGGIFLPNEYLASSGAVAIEAKPLNLTPRQWQILYSILRGKSIKHIARDLDIAGSTVKAHVTPVLRELGVATRTEAIVRAGQLGLRIPYA